MTLIDLKQAAGLQTEQECIAYLENLRWPGGVRCPVCGHDRISRFQTKGKTGKVRHLFQCLEKECRHQFSPTTGTIFHDSHLPLKKWFTAIDLVSNAGGALSVNQLRQPLEVQYKTAKNIVGRIQHALEAGTIETGEAMAAPKKPVAASSAIGKATRVARPDQSAARKISAKPKKNKEMDAPPPPPGMTASGRPTVVDNFLTVLGSVMQMSVQSPIVAVNYIRHRVMP